MTYATAPRDCIVRVTSQNGNPVIFERLATPRPAPKVMLKSNLANTAAATTAASRSSPTLDKDVPSIWKQRATWESRTGVRDDTEHATEVERASRKLVQDTYEAVGDSHLTEKALTDAFSNNEANTQEIERVKIGSNKICIREDLANEKMVFSKESSRAIFEMSNVELIELKKTSIQCPSCVSLKEHFSANAVSKLSATRT